MLIHNVCARCDSIDLLNRWDPFSTRLALFLVLLQDSGLDQRQILAEEALEATVGPGAGVGLLLVLVGALLNVRLQGGLVLTALAQLCNQVVDLEALGVLEQLELVEDALDVVAGDLIVGVLEGLVLGNQSLGHLVGFGALLAYLLQILGGTQFVLSSGGLQGSKSTQLATEIKPVG